MVTTDSKSLVSVILHSGQFNRSIHKEGFSGMGRSP